MKIKQTIRNMVAGSLLVFSLIGVQFALSTPSYAAESCAGVETAIIKCDNSGQGDDIKDSGLWGILMIVVNILMGGVAVLALAGVVYGAVLYTSAGGNPEQVKKAKGIFTNVVIGVLAFAGMYVLLNFLIPGAPLEGIFN